MSPHTLRRGGAVVLLLALLGAAFALSAAAEAARSDHPWAELNALLSLGFALLCALPGILGLIAVLTADHRPAVAGSCLAVAATVIGTGLLLWLNSLIKHYVG